MSKSGIRIISETIGTGPIVKRTDHVRVLYDIQLSRGDFLVQDQRQSIALDDRHLIAGFRYGIEGMRTGGTREFRASPHLCYRDAELERIPKNAVLIISIKELNIVA